MASFTEEDPTMPVDLENSSSLGQLGDVTFGLSVPRRDVSLTLLERMSAGRRSPVRAKTMKEYDQEMADLKKENFDLKLRIYFLEDRMKIHSRGDEFKLNIELNVQVESLKKDLVDKQELLRQATTALDGHLAQWEVQRERARAEGFGEGRALQAHLEGQLAERQKALETAEDALEGMRKQLETAVDMKLADALRNEAAGKDEEICRLRKERIDHEEQVVRPLQIAVHELEEVLRNRDAAIEKLSDELRDATLLHNKSASQQKEYEQELDEQRQQIEEFKVIVDQFGKECTTKDQRLKVLEQQLLHKDQELKELKNSLNELNKHSNEKQENLEAHYKTLLEEAHRQATAKERLVERLGRQLQETEKQLQANVELAERQQAAAEGQAAERRDGIVASLREKLKDKEKQMEAVMEEKFKAQEEKDAQIQALRHALRQKERDGEECRQQVVALTGEMEAKEKECREKEKAVRELALALKAAQRASETAEDNYKCISDEQNNATKRLEEALRSRDHQISALQAAAEERPSEAVVTELRRLLASKDKQLRDALAERAELATACEQTAAEHADKLRHKDVQMKALSEKYTKEIRNLEEQLLQLQLELGRKSYELQAFSGHLRGSNDARSDILDHLRDALVEKDKTIAALVESAKDKDALLRRWQDGTVTGSPAQVTLLLPQTTVSSPRHSASVPDDSADQEIQRLRSQVEYLRRELQGRDSHYYGGDVSLGSSPRSGTSHSRATKQRVKVARSPAFAGMLKDLLRSERELYESLKHMLSSSSPATDKERSLEAALRDMAALRDRAVASIEASELLKSTLEHRLQALEHSSAAAAAAVPPNSKLPYIPSGAGTQSTSLPSLAASTSSSSSSSSNADSANDGHIVRPKAEPKTPSRRTAPAHESDEGDDVAATAAGVGSIPLADTRTMIANRLEKAKSKVHLLEERLLVLSNEAVDGAVSSESSAERSLKRLAAAQLENRRLQDKLAEAEQKVQSSDSVAVLLRQQLELNTQTPEHPAGFNPDLIVSMAHEIERLKRRLGGKISRADAAVGSDADATESESAPEEELDSLRRQLASSRNVVNLLKRQIELNSVSNDSSAMTFNPQLIVDMAAEIERLKEEQRQQRRQRERVAPVSGSTDVPFAQIPVATSTSSGSRHKSGIPMPLKAALQPRGSSTARLGIAGSRDGDSGNWNGPQISADGGAGGQTDRDMGLTQQLLEAQARARELERKLAATESTVRQQSRRARFYRSMLEEAGLVSVAAPHRSRSASESNLLLAAASISSNVTESAPSLVRRGSLGSRPRSSSAATMGLLPDQLTLPGSAPAAMPATTHGTSAGQSENQQVLELRRQLERYACVIRSLEARIRFGSAASLNDKGCAVKEALPPTLGELHERLRRSEETRQALEEALLTIGQQAPAWPPTSAAAAAAAAGDPTQLYTTRDSGDGEGGTSAALANVAAVVAGPAVDRADSTENHPSSAVAIEVKGLCMTILGGLVVVADELHDMLAQDDEGEVPCADVTAARVTAVKQKVGECIAHMRYMSTLMEEGSTESGAAAQQPGRRDSRTESTLQQHLPAGEYVERDTHYLPGGALPRRENDISRLTQMSSLQAGHVASVDASSAYSRLAEQPWGGELDELYGELERRAELLGSANRRVEELDCEVQRLTDERRIKDELIKQLQERVRDLENQLSGICSTSDPRPAGARPGHKIASSESLRDVEKHGIAGNKLSADGTYINGRHPAANMAALERSASIADGSDGVSTSRNYPRRAEPSSQKNTALKTTHPRERAEAASSDIVGSSGAEEGSLSNARSDRDVLSNRYFAAPATEDFDDSGSDAGSLVSEALSDGSHSHESGSTTPASALEARVVSKASPGQASIHAAQSACGLSSRAPSEKEQLRKASDGTSASESGRPAIVLLGSPGYLSHGREPRHLVYDMADLITVGSASPMSSRNPSCSSTRQAIALGENGSIESDDAASETPRAAAATDGSTSSDVFIEDAARSQSSTNVPRAGRTPALLPVSGTTGQQSRTGSASRPARTERLDTGAAPDMQDHGGNMTSHGHLNKNSSAADGRHQSSASTQTSAAVGDGRRSRGGAAAAAPSVGSSPATGTSRAPQESNRKLNKPTSANQSGLALRSSGAGSQLPASPSQTFPDKSAGQHTLASAIRPAVALQEQQQLSQPSIGVDSYSEQMAASGQEQHGRQKLALLSWESDDEDDYDLRSGDGQEELARGGLLYSAPNLTSEPDRRILQNAQQPYADAVLSLYEQELNHLHGQLEAASELNATLREELQLHESLWRHQEVRNAPSGMSNGRPAQAATRGKREDGQSLLNKHLDEIRALRERLEAAITNNNQLREDLEKKLAIDESRSSDATAAQTKNARAGGSGAEPRSSLLSRRRVPQVREQQGVPVGASGAANLAAKTEAQKTAALLKAAMLSLRRKKERLAAQQVQEQQLRAALEQALQDAERFQGASERLEKQAELSRRLEGNLRRAQEEAAALRVRQQRLEAEADRARGSADAVRTHEQQLCDDLARALADAGEARRRESHLEEQVASASRQAAQLQLELRQAKEDAIVTQQREAALAADLQRACDQVTSLRAREQQLTASLSKATDTLQDRLSHTRNLEEQMQRAAESSQSREKQLAESLRSMEEAVTESQSREKALADSLEKAAEELATGQQREALLGAESRRLSRELAESSEFCKQLSAELKQATESLAAGRAQEKQLAFDLEQASEDAAAARLREQRLESELRRAGEDAAAAAEREQRLTEELSLVRRSAELRLDSELRAQERRLRSEADADRSRLVAEVAGARTALALTEEQLAAARQHDAAECEREVAMLKQRALESAENLLREVKARDEQLAEKERLIADGVQQRQSLELTLNKQKEDFVDQVAHKERSIKDLKNELNRALEELEILRDRVAETQGVNETLKFELSVLETLRPLSATAGIASASSVGSLPLSSDAGPRLTVKDGTANLDLTSFFDEMRRLRVQLERSIDANNKLRQKLEESMVRRHSQKQLRAADGHHEAEADTKEATAQCSNISNGSAGNTSRHERPSSRSARRSLFSRNVASANGQGRPWEGAGEDLTLGDLATQDFSPSQQHYGRSSRHGYSQGLASDSENDDAVDQRNHRDRKDINEDAGWGHSPRYGSVPSLAKSPGLQLPSYGYQDSLSPRSHSVTRIDSDIQTLFAVCRLPDYEMLKKENEQCLVTLSAVEARIQDRLDAFAAATAPSSGGNTGQLHWSLEYSTLRELKHCVDELRSCLFEEKRLVTLFWITRLPGSLPGNRSASPELYLARENKHMREELSQVKGKYRALQKMVGNLADTVDRSKSLKGADLANYVTQLTEINRVLGRAKRNLKQKADDGAVL